MSFTQLRSESNSSTSKKWIERLRGGKIPARIKTITTEIREENSKINNLHTSHNRTLYHHPKIQRRYTVFLVHPNESFHFAMRNVRNCLFLSQQIYCNRANWFCKTNKNMGNFQDWIQRMESQNEMLDTKTGFWVVRSNIYNTHSYMYGTRRITKWHISLHKQYVH